MKQPNEVKLGQSSFGKFQQVNSKMKRGLFQNQSSFKRAYAKIIHNVLRRHKFSRVAFIALSLVETLQTIYFSLHPSFAFNRNFPLISQVSEVLSFLNADRYIDASFDFIVFLGISYFMLISLLLIFVRLCKIIIRNSYWGEYELLDELGLEVINVFLILVRTIIFLPWCFAVIYSFRIFQIDWFSLYINIVLVALSAVALVVLVCFTFMSTSHFVYRNPFVESYMAGPKNRNSELKVIAKIMLVAYLSADPRLQNQTAFLVYSYLLNVFLFYRLYCYESYYDKLLDQAIVLLTYAPVYVQTIVLVHILLPYDQISFIVFAGVFGIMLFIYMMARRKRRQQAYLYHELKFKRQSALLNYVYCLIEGIKNKMISMFYIRLAGALRYHCQVCESTDCRCQDAAQVIQKQAFEEFAVYNFISSTLYYYLALDKEEFNDRTALLAGYISNWKEEIVSKSLFYLDSAIKAIAAIPQLCTETCVYREMLMIEDSMKKNDIKNVKNVDFNKFYDFQKKLSVLESMIETNVEITLRFWQEIKYDKTNLRNIRQLGNEIIKQRQIIEEKHHQLQKQNSSKEKLQVYIIYVMFIVANDAFEKLKKNIDKNTPTRLLKNYFSEDLKNELMAQKGIVVLSGNIDIDFGCVVFCNRYIKHLYGYTFKDLQKKNIKVMMPQVIATHHDEILDGYLLKQKPSKKRDGLLVSTIDKDGYLVPSYLVQKVLPKLDRGIEIVGFMTVLKEDTKYAIHHVLYRGDTEEVVAISKELRLKYGIQSNRKLWEVFEGWTNTSEIQNQMRSKEGYSTYLKDDQNGTGMTNFTKPAFLLKLKWEIFYFKVHVRMIAMQQARTIGTSFNKSKISEAVSIGSKNNVSIMEDSGNKIQTSDVNYIGFIKIVRMILNFAEVVCFAVIFGLILSQVDEIPPILSQISTSSNISNGLSQTTYYLRQIQLQDTYSPNYLANDSWSKLSEWHQQLNTRYYELISARVDLNFDDISVNSWLVGLRNKTTFEKALQDYTAQLYNVLYSSGSYNFNPNLQSIVESPLFYRFYKIVKNSVQVLLTASRNSHNLEISKLLYKTKMIDFWSITGATLAILALLIGVVYFLINQIKKRLDQAIGIFSYVNQQELELILGNCTAFLDYYFSSMSAGENIQTTAMNEDDRLNKNARIVGEVLNRDEDTYFTRVTIMLVFFFLLSFGIFFSMAFVIQRLQQQTNTSIEIIRSLQNRVILFNFLRTYSIQSIFNPSYKPTASNLIIQGFLNQRTLSSNSQSSKLTQYKQKITYLNQQNICTQVQITDCETLEGGILQRGASSAVSSYLEYTRLSLAVNVTQGNQLQELKNSRYESMNKLLDALVKTTRVLVGEIDRAYGGYIEGERRSIQIIGVSFAIFMMLGLLVLWMPLGTFVESESTWSKNFMKLIPAQTIQNSEELKALTNVKGQDF